MKTIKLKITGMHCVSCSMTIDGELEDTNGIISANTSFARSECIVQFDPHIISPEQIQKIIGTLDYTTQIIAS